MGDWLQVASVLKCHQSSINSLDFTKDGELLLSSGDDARIALHSTTKGKTERVALCAANGASLARFTHDPLSIIHASPVDHAVRYMSLHDNRYMRAFRAHTEPITSLEMSPKEDFFTSAAMDGTARIWDLRTTNCQGVLRFEANGHRPVVSFDPLGMVFAAAIGGSQVKLYDVRGFDKGPFETFAPDLGGRTSFSSLKFSNDGKLMLLSTTRGAIALLDAYHGTLLHTLSGHANEQGMPLEASFTPDGQFVVAGAEDGGIWRWSVVNGQAFPVVREHNKPVRVIRCNPTRTMLVSACSALCLWLPPG